jgi:hypothetical protein
LRKRPWKPDDFFLADATKNDDVRTVKTLLAAGADQTSCNVAFLWATKLAHAEILDVLLAEGIDSETLSEALIIASTAGHTDIIKTLQTAGAGTDIPTRNAALIWASWYGHSAAVSLLLAAGIHVQAANAALCAAGWRGQTETVKILLAAGTHRAARNQSHLWAKLRGHADTARILSRAGATARANGRHSRLYLLQKRALEYAEVFVELARFGLASSYHRFESMVDLSRPGLEDELKRRFFVARALASIGLVEDALIIAEAVLAGQITLLGPNHPDTIDTVELIADLKRRTALPASDGFEPKVRI